MKLLPIVLATGLACAQSLSPPLLGIARDEMNRLRPVYGIAGNFILGQADGGEVLSMAFSGKLGFAKTATQLLLLDENGAASAQYPAPPGNALFAFYANGTPAFCYFEATGELWQIVGNAIEAVQSPELDAGDRVLALKVTGRTPQLISRNTAGQPNGPVLAIAGGILRAGGAGLLWQLDAGPQIDIPIDGVIRSLDQIGDGWTLVATPAGNYVLRIATGKVYRLPAGGAPK